MMRSCCVLDAEHVVGIRPRSNLDASTGAVRPRSGLGLALAGLLATTLALSLTAAAPSLAQDDHELSIEEVLSTPLEDLLNIQVTTVAGVKQEWLEAPGALYVITGEDIRRTGHHTLADALRMAPGVFVGSTSSHSWTVGMRGFSGGLANKTLVLIDGRAVYDPLFAGTFWDVQDVLLADVDRIEVIRGPGATLWGANAVNGVINVITKRAADTQGAYLKVGAGTEEHGFTSARYGGKLSDNGAFRVWGKYFNRDDLTTVTGDSPHDEWDMGHGGFRADLEVDERTTFTLQGDAYNLRFDERVNVPVPNQNSVFTQREDRGKASGGNMLLRISRAETETSGWTLQTYYDRTYRRQTADFEVERDTADVDFRHYFAVARSHEIMWGLGYRHSADETAPSVGNIIVFDPDSRTLNTYSAFVQDTVTIVPDRLTAMIGSKFDHNTYTDFEVQPSARLWWTPDDRNTVWAAISRPVRHPTRTERESILTLRIAETAPGVFTPVQVVGNRDLESEELLAYELGYRARLTSELTLDIATFYNDYSELIFIPPTTSGVWTDEGSGETYGAEIATQWRATDQWTIEGSYSYVEVLIHGPVLPQDEGNAPVNQVKARSYWDITKNLELNTAVYYVDRVPTADADPYVRFDTGVTWRPRDGFELSIWGQNLLDESHREASSFVEAERAGFVEAVIRF
jgi:iron complex outermembrane receptor protein